MVSKRQQIHFLVLFIVKPSSALTLASTGYNLADIEQRKENNFSSTSFVRQIKKKRE